MGLLKVATVIQGDGDWTAGYEIESWGCSIGEYITDVCTPTPILVSGSDYLDQATHTVKAGAGKAGSVKIHPFAYTVGLARGVRCLGDLESAKVAEYIAASEIPIAKMFGGIDSNTLADTVETLWTTSDTSKPSVVTVPKGSDLKTSLKNLFMGAASKNSLSDLVLHLGIGSAFNMTQDLWETIEHMDVKVAVSPGYTEDLVALTGPVTVRLSSIQQIKTNNATKNEVYFEATRLAAIEFDPCLAFRAA